MNLQLIIERFTVLVVSRFITPPAPVVLAFTKVILFKTICGELSPLIIKILAMFLASIV